MLSTTRRRALAALAATTLAAGLAVAGAAPAQALAGSKVTLVGATASVAPNGGGRLVTFLPNLDVADPTTPGTAFIEFQTMDTCGAPYTETSQTIPVDHDGIYTITQAVPLHGYVRIYVHLSDGLGGQWDMPGNYAAWTDADILPSVTATITPDATVVGSGVVDLAAGTAMNTTSYEVYVDGTMIESHWVLWCDTDTFSFSGFAAGQVVEVKTSSANDAVLATLALPDLAAAVDDPPAPGGNGPAASADPSLAATGTDALPYLTVAALLLAAGAATVLLARRRRFAD